MNYYNDNDQFAVKWLKELIADGLIPKGDVDDRSITDIKPSDLAGYTQCHFFAGIGGWAYALRLAGWPEDREVWTGSCPCQPFSVAGKGEGLNDPRHLWPAFRWLIAQCKPATVFGEQVASKDGRTWLAGVRSDLETLGYRVGAADLCAAGIGTPHIRQRLWWVGDTPNRKDHGRETGIMAGEAQQRGCCDNASDVTGANGGLAHSEGTRERGNQRIICDEECRQRNALYERSGGASQDSGLADAEGIGRGEGQPDGTGRIERDTQRQGAVTERYVSCFGVGISDCSGSQQGVQASAPVGYGRPVEPANFWGASVWWPCRDGKYRRVPARWMDNTEKWEIEPALFPLADGLPNRVGILRGAGNAISPQVAEEFIRAFLDIQN